MKKRCKWILAGAAIVLAAMLLVNPARTNPPVTPGHDLFATNSPPAEIAGLLRNACYDCHSSETHWPWYSHVAPASWFLASHVNDGRKHLNFSDWPHDDARRAARKWRHVAEEVRNGSMPIPTYTWLHASARLSAEQRAQLAGWAEQEAGRLLPDSEAKDP